jgi:Glycosyltransferase Family 4
MDHRHAMLRWTRWIERIATRWPDHVIAVSQQCKDILVARGVDAGKILVPPNTPSVAVGPTDSESVATDSPFIVTHCCWSSGMASRWRFERSSC